MKLETYAAKYGVSICDWSSVWNARLAKRGWRCLAVLGDEDHIEPDMLLIKSPDWDNYQVRDLFSGIPSGRMLTEFQIKEWIKKRYGRVRKGNL
ncbi:hypothetical protein [Pseudomonas saliphila]|uniref:hypothetical protein n=1 Tax=Pseudomonas saliphila TaxID=2586906 RepID=UPI00123A7571|nr:hypothetical protein [Pseudomonas saliphila]